MSNIDCQNFNYPYYSVYCLKALGAFFVICIHTLNYWFIEPIIRTAVPIFFMISGFFIYNPDKTISINKCVKLLKKILWLTVFANLWYYFAFYFPANLYPLNTPSKIINFILIGNNLGFHLWYLNALIESLIILILCFRFGIKFSCWFILSFLIVGLLFGSYSFIFSAIPYSLILSRNFLTMGLPCIIIGWFIRKYFKQIQNKIKIPWFWILIITFLGIFEAWCIFADNENYAGDYLITTIPLAALLLFVLLLRPKLGHGTLLASIGKKYSTFIYVFHIIFLSWFEITANKFNFSFNQWLVPFIVLFLTLIFSILLKKIINSLA